jgi:hypothetical protein
MNPMGVGDRDLDEPLVLALADGNKTGARPRSAGACPGGERIGDPFGVVGGLDARFPGVVRAWRPCGCPGPIAGDRLGKTAFLPEVG